MNPIAINISKALLFLSLSAGAQAQIVSDAKPLRIIVITSPGGQADTVARILAEGLGKTLRRTVLVENKVGAGGNIATEYVARQPADGTVLLLTSNNHTINPTLFKKVDYDYQKSFVPVTQLTRGPSVIAAHPGLNIKDMRDLVPLSKNRELSYGSTGIGSAANLAMEMFRKESGVKIVHIPYKGAGPAVADAMGGQVQLISVSLTSAIAQIKAGKLTALAVTTQNRWPGAPEIPSLREQGCVTCVYETFLGIFAPKGTSPSYVKEINEHITLALGDSATKTRLLALGAEPVLSTPEEFSTMLKNDFESVAQVIRETGMTAD
jgi:tripartite-type tricarboxylate transporter receptor subunit TctC